MKLEEAKKVGYGLCARPNELFVQAGVGGFKINYHKYDN